MTTPSFLSETVSSATDSLQNDTISNGTDALHEMAQFAPLPVILPLQVTCDVLRVLSGLLALATNGLMTTAFVKYPDLRTLSNTFVVNLCVVDCMAALMNLNIPLVHYLPAQTAWVSSFLQICISSAYSIAEFLALFFIGVDRCIHVMKPIKYITIVTKSRTVKLLVLFWIIVVLVACLPLAYSSEVASRSRLGYYEARSYITNFVVVCIEILVLSVLYGYILYYVQKTLKNSVHPTNVSLATSPRYKRFKIAAVVLALYIIASGPWFISTALLMAGVLQPIDFILVCVDTNFTFYSVQTWINPLVYGWRDQKLNAAFRKLLRLSNPAVPQTTSTQQTTRTTA